MGKSFTSYTAILALLSLFAVGVYATKVHAKAPPQYPILDMAANRVIQKYQNSTCEQLWMKKTQKAPPSAEGQRVLGFLKSDPQMRTLFIDKVAAPVANKMFECGMIP